MLRIGDLVQYGHHLHMSNLGVYLGDVTFDVYDNHHKFYSVTACRVRTTLARLGLLSRLALPDDPRSTPARGDPG